MPNQKVVASGLDTMIIFLTSVFLPSISFFGEGEYFVGVPGAFAGDQRGTPFVPVWTLAVFVMTD